MSAHSSHHHCSPSRAERRWRGRVRAMRRLASVVSPCGTFLGAAIDLASLWPRHSASPGSGSCSTSFSSTLGSACRAASSSTSSSSNSSTSSSPGAPGSKSSRFFGTVDVRAAPDGTGWQVYLGKHAVKTPARHTLVLPTRALALAVAAEWEWQDSNKPATHTMPIMSLAATAVDQPKPRPAVIQSVLRFLHTDSALCRYDPGPVAQRQAQVFDPMVQWARRELGWADLHPSDSVFGAHQSAQVEAKALALLESLDAWELAAVEQLTACGKSLVLALAMLHGLRRRRRGGAPAASGDGAGDPAAAAAAAAAPGDPVATGPHVALGDGLHAARLEEIVQTDEWGVVEAGHDLDTADAGSRVAAPVLMLRLLQQKP